MASPKVQLLAHYFFLLYINGTTLSEVESVTYLGATLTNNANCTAHIEDIFRKCVRLSFFVKKLRMLSTPAEFIRRFVETCVVP